MSGKQAKKNKYDSEKRLVACTCGECVSECGTKGKKIPKYDERKHRQKEEKAKKSKPVPRAHAKVTKIVAGPSGSSMAMQTDIPQLGECSVPTPSPKHQELLIGTPAVPPSLPLSSPTGTSDPPTGLADTNADLFDMLASGMPSPVSEMDVSVAGFDFASEMDIDEIQSSTGDNLQQDQLLETEDMFLNDTEMPDGHQFSDMPPLLDDFSDAEDEGSGPQRTSEPLVGPTSLLGLLDRAFPPSNTGEDMLAPAAAVPGSDEMQHDDTTAITNDTPVDRPSRPACEVLDDASPYWFWKIILLLVPWLNLHYHLPHRANNLILKVLAVIFYGLGVFGVQDKPEQTLKTVYTRLELSDQFHIHPLCPSCCRVFPPDSDSTTRCSDCGVFLFRGVTASSSEAVVPSDEDTAMPSLPNSSTPAPTSGPKTRSSAPFKHKPKLQCAQHPLSNALLRLIWQDGIEKEVDQWRKDQSPPGTRTRIQDGEVWKSLRGADGKLFFDNSPDRSDQDELRIGITLGFDGYSYERSAASSSHSSGVMSSCIANLPTHLRYRPRNLLLFGITPGPKEFNSDQLQHFMKNYVDDLLALYDNGIFIKTPEHPDGRRIRVILVAVCCDHPAMCKVCGFGNHSKEEGFCTRCHIPKSKLATEDAMHYDKFPARDGQEHIRRAREYRDLPTDQRDGFFKKHSARWFELSRLPYFDPVRMTVIDPMHSFLLGMIRCQWFTSWIKNNTLRQRTATAGVPRELDQIHLYLSKFEMPSWVARLPDQVGYPAGGSLTSDEWKGLALVFGPIVIPLIWDEWYPKNKKAHDASLANWEKREADRIKRNTTGKAKKGDEKASEKPVMQMHEDSGSNFLNLAAALKIILGRTVKDADIPRAKHLLHEYLIKFIKIHPKDVKPTHHWVTHIFDQLRDYGPVYGFWTFLFERLNKLLKSYSTNNHGAGELEVSFFRAFEKDRELRTMLGNILAAEKLADENDGSRLVVDCIRLMLATDGDTRGTVASLALETEQSSVDVNIRFSLGTHTKAGLSRDQQHQLIIHYQNTNPQARVVSVMTRASTENPDPNYLLTRANFHNYIILDGRRVASSSSLVKASNSIIQVDLNDTRYVGQVFTIISHSQRGIERESILLDVKWFRRKLDINLRHWVQYPELEVFLWGHEMFLDPAIEGPPQLIPPDLVISQACRLTLQMKDDQDRSVDVWATVGLSREVQVF